MIMSAIYFNMQKKKQTKNKPSKNISNKKEKTHHYIHEHVHKISFYLICYFICENFLFYTEICVDISLILTYKYGE